MSENNFKIGDLIIYKNGDSYEIGKIKRLAEDGAFVFYHEGDTAAKTPYDCMYKLINDFTIKNTSLGGEEIEKADKITQYLIKNIFRNDDYYQFHDEETTLELLWYLMEVISSLHNEYYKAINGRYYDYMFHWVNKMNADTIIDDLFKKGERT